MRSMRLRVIPSVCTVEWIKVASPLIWWARSRTRRIRLLAINARADVLPVSSRMALVRVPTVVRLRSLPPVGVRRQPGRNLVMSSQTFGTGGRRAHVRKHSEEVSLVTSCR